jgi:hypothetical protein
MRAGERSFLRALLRHVVILTLVSTPVALTVFAAIPSTLDSQGNFLDRLLDLSVLYPGLALYAALGTVPYTIALALINRYRSPSGRVVTLLATPVALLPWLLLPARYLIVIPPFAAGLTVGLVILGLLADMPSAAPAASRDRDLS